MTQEQKAPRKLLSGKLKRAEFERTVYRIKPEDGTEFEDIMKPEYWAHVGRVLRPFDIIEVLFENGTHYVELVVVDCGDLWAKVAVKTDLNLATEKKSADEVREEAVGNAPYSVAYKGPTVKWAVIRNSDNEYVEKGMATKAEAESWLTNYLKALAA